MALTPAERQKRRRQRVKEERRKAPDLAGSYLKRPFSEFIDEHRLAEWLDAQEGLSTVSVELPAFDSDEDREWQDDWGVPNRGAIGRAERLVDAMVQAAQIVAELINRYKLAEIDRAIAELEAADLSTPAAKKKALAEAVRLNAIRTRLTKEVRHSLHATTVKGEEGAPQG